MIRRRIFAALLTLGVIFGYGSGIASLAWHHHHSCGSSCGSDGAAWGNRWAPPAPRVDPAVAAVADREAFKAEVAAACADAVRRSLPPPAPAYAPQAPAPQMVPMPFAVPYPQFAPPPPAPPAPPAPAGT